MSINKLGNNLYVAQGFCYGYFFSASGFTQQEALEKFFNYVSLKLLKI